MAKPTVMIHDGAIDEFVAAILLDMADEIDLQGVVMVDADCLGVTACDVLYRMQRLAGLDTPIGLSKARGANAFPWTYRSDCVRVADLTLISDAPAPPWTAPPDGDDLLVEILRQASSPVTVVATGPITPLVQAVERYPDLLEQVDSVIWMAGAIEVAGNLDPTTLPAPVANPYAEWNVFWDPTASQRAFELFDGRITLVPLDISNQLPIDKAFMASLLKQGRSGGFGRVCLDIYGLVSAEPFYRLWDTATVAALVDPSLFASPRTDRLRVETRVDSDVGAIVVDPAGADVDVVLGFGQAGAAAVTADILRRIAAVDSS